MKDVKGLGNIWGVTVTARPLTRKASIKTANVGFPHIPTHAVVVKASHDEPHDYELPYLAAPQIL